MKIEFIQQISKERTIEMVGEEYVLKIDELEKAAVDFVHDYCKERDAQLERPVVKKATKEQVNKVKNIGFPKKGRPVREVMEQMEKDIFAPGSDNGHPRFFGFVPGPFSGVSWLGDIILNAYNMHGGGSSLAPTVSCAEQEVIKWMADKAGFGEGASGVFVSGGSMGNMTALTAARDKKLDDENMHLGVAYVSDQTHSSVAKGLRIIGIPTKRVRRIPTDEHFQMKIDELEKAISEDEKNGMIPFAVIGTAGTTNTGSIDPLDEIGDICKKHDVWFHVDGAIGGALLISDKYKHLLKGVEKADSLTVDGHKLLFQTYGCAMVLAKEPRYFYNSFHVSPEYFKDIEDTDELPNMFDLGIELTRPMRGLKLWMTLQVLGSDVFAAAIEQGFEQVKWAQAELEKKDNWEIVSPAQMIMLNFRFAPEDLTLEQQDKLNVDICTKLNETGFAGMFTTVLEGKTVVRMCALHPETTKEDVIKTMEMLDKFANQVYHDRCNG